MNRDIFKGHWKEYKGKVKQMWGKLTDDDLTKIHGKSEELCGVLQKKYGYSREEAEKNIDKFIEENERVLKEKDKF